MDDYIILESKMNFHNFGKSTKSELSNAQKKVLERTVDRQNLEIIRLKEELQEIQINGYKERYKALSLEIMHERNEMARLRKEINQLRKKLK